MSISASPICVCLYLGGGIAEIYTTHHYAKTPEEAVAFGLKSGTDVNCGSYYHDHGQSAYNQGLINDTDLDRALMRQFVSLVRMGYFDNGANQPYRQYGLEQVNSAAHQRLSVLAALESIVLLKNAGGLLPLPGKTAINIALIGPNSAASETLLGNYQSPVPYIISIPNALDSRNIKYTHVAGTAINTTNTTGFAAAVNAARTADYVIYVGGLDQSIEAEGHDRPDIGLPGNQNDLIQAISAVSQKPIIVVVLGGGQVDLTQWKSSSQVGGILWAGYPGQSGGEAIVQILLGEYSPSALLCSTMYPAAYVSQVSMLDQSMRPSASNPGRTYKWYNNAVYNFGDGLSYSTFIYQRQDQDIKQAELSHPNQRDTLTNTYDIATLASNARVDTKHADIAYWLTINNTGTVISDVVALAFLVSNTSIDGVVPPNKELFDFVHVRQLPVGGSVTVFFQMSYRSLVHTDLQGHQWLLPGEYTISINNDRVWEYTFNLVGKPTMVKEWPQQAQSAVEQLATMQAKPQMD